MPEWAVLLPNPSRKLPGNSAVPPLVDTVFISCTNLRALSIIRELESTLGKPVISSNQVLGWHCLRLANVDVSLPQYGMIFGR
jgi:maleate isomerase